MLNRIAKTNKAFLFEIFLRKIKFNPAKKIQNSKDAGLIIAMLPALSSNITGTRDLIKEFAAMPAKPNAIKQNNNISN